MQPVDVTDLMTNVAGASVHLLNLPSTSKNFFNLNDPDIESQWFVLRPHRLPRGINSIIFGTVYNPPQNDNDKLRAHLFHSSDSALAAYPNSGIFVLGDFDHFVPGNLCSSFKLKTLVSLPTRGNNTLDQIYSSLSKYHFWRQTNQTAIY